MFNALPHLHVIAWPLVFALLILLCIVHDKHEKDIWGPRP